MLDTEFAFHSSSVQNPKLTRAKTRVRFFQTLLIRRQYLIEVPLRKLSYWRSNGVQNRWLQSQLKPIDIWMGRPNWSRASPTQKLCQSSFPIHRISHYRCSSQTRFWPFEPKIHMHTLSSAKRVVALQNQCESIWEKLEAHRFVRYIVIPGS